MSWIIGTALAARWMPSGTADDAQTASWKVNGLVKIRTRDGAEA